jgi:hypothetical protein
MVWSKWKGAICMAALACASLTCVGLVFSQQSGSRPASSGADSANVITLNEPGKPPVRAIVLKEYRTPDGKIAQDVKNLSTGELFTLYKEAPAATAKAGKTDVAQTKANPASPPKEVPLPSKTAAPIDGSAQYRTIQEAGKPAIKCTVMAEWKTSEGMKACQLKAIESGEIITVVQTGPVDAPSVNGTKAMATRIYHWGRSTTPPAGVPMPPAHVAFDSEEKAMLAVGKSAADATLPLAPVPAGATPMPGLPQPPTPALRTPTELVMKTNSPASCSPCDKTVATTLPSSQIVKSKQSDPLSTPESFASARIQDRAPGLKEMKTNQGPTPPLGAGSVVASGNSPQYVPVPMVTVPQSNPPAPPAAQLPKPPTQAPNPTWYVNAFTPPLPPNSVPDSSMAQQHMQMVAVVPPGYPAGPGGNPAMVGYQGVAYLPVPMPISGPGRGSVPMAYQGPAPPTPIMGQPANLPMMAQGYGMMPAPAYSMMAEQPHTAPQVSLQQSIGTLQTSIYPSQREIAVQHLSQIDPRSNPQLAQILLQTAKSDPAPTVRAACVAGLVRMGVQGENMVRTCIALKADSDIRVRSEAERALEILSSQRGGQLVQPARAVNPQ